MIMETPMSTVQKSPAEKGLKCIYIAPELHRQIKICAAQQGKSIREYVEAVLEPAEKAGRRVA